MTDENAVLTLKLDFPVSTKPEECMLTYEILPMLPLTEGGFTIDLPTDGTNAQVLTIELDGTIPASDLKGTSKEITITGLNTGQTSADVEPLVININFIECPEVNQTACTTCNRELFEVVDAVNSDYIWASTKGCTKCRYGWEQYLYPSTETPGEIIRDCT